MATSAGSFDGSLDSGWAAYLTLHSQEANRRSDCQAKIDLSKEAGTTDDRKKLYDELIDENHAIRDPSRRRHECADAG